MKLSLALFLTAAAIAPGQTPSPDLKFDVASLKPAQPDPQFGGIRPAPGGQEYDGNAVSVRMMLMVAYRLKTDQIVGGPAWMDTELFDMHAKAEKPSTPEELHIMLINLLAERFQMKTHFAPAPSAETNS